MKKLITGLLAAFLLGTGLVAFSGSTTPASAVCGDPVYTGCYRTVTALIADREGQTRRYEITAGVVAEGTNAIPNGRLSFRFKRVGSPNPSFAVRALRPSDEGIKSVLRTLRPGRWNIRVTYIPNERTLFQGSRSNNVQIDVPGRRR